ncbi:hypothetical protein ACHAPU_005780 [Fusarium lateritium]
MSAQTSKSIFLSAEGKLLVQAVTTNYTIEGPQCLVHVDFSAINFCDYNFFYMGLNSFITGFEMSGTVKKTGPDSPFQVGDIIFGILPVVIPIPSSHGTHQDVVIARSQIYLCDSLSQEPRRSSRVGSHQLFRLQEPQRG